MVSYKRGDRVRIGTRDGAVFGNVVWITKAGLVAIQPDYYSDRIYRKPGHVHLVGEVWRNDDST